MEVQVLSKKERDFFSSKYYEILPFYLNPQLTGNFDCLLLKKGTHPVALFTAIPRTESNDFFFPYNQPFIIENNPNLTSSKKNDILFDVYEGFYKYLLRESKDLIFTTDPLYNSDLRPFLWNTYNPQSDRNVKMDLRYTGILNLSNADNIEANYSGSRKRDLRYSQGLCSSEIIDPNEESIDLLYKFYRENFERQSQRFDIERDFFLEMINSNCFQQLIIADVDSQPCYSAIISIADRKCVYHFASGNHNGYKNFASSYAIDLAIQYALRNNCTWFNVEGVNSPLRGSFKLSYGLELAEYHEVSMCEK